MDRGVGVPVWERGLTAVSMDSPSSAMVWSSKTA